VNQRASLGQVIRKIRAERRWTLAEMSEAVGFPLSTLSKIEHDRLSLTYDKLLQLSDRLGIGLQELFSNVPPPPSRSALSRRSISHDATTISVTSRNYEDHYLCADLRKKVMTPIYIIVKASTLEEFGPLVRHSGEDFVFVVSGSIVVHTEYYEPTTLNEGGSLYLDSQMGHAYLRAPNCEEANIIAVCASKADGLDAELIQQARGFQSSQSAKSAKTTHKETKIKSVKSAPRRRKPTWP
jgi:transcriptional regulator with XRE-family HTH domain